MSRKRPCILGWRPGLGVIASNDPDERVSAVLLNPADPDRRHVLALSADDAERLGRDLLFFAERARALSTDGYADLRRRALFAEHGNPAS